MFIGGGALLVVCVLKWVYRVGYAQGREDTALSSGEMKVGVKVMRYIASSYCGHPPDGDCQLCWVRNWAREELQDLGIDVAPSAAPEFSATVKAKQTSVTTVTDPDTHMPVDVAIFKEEGGAMIGVDASYLEQDVGPAHSPVGNGILVIEEGTVDEYTLEGELVDVTAGAEDVFHDFRGRVIEDEGDLVVVLDQEDNAFCVRRGQVEVVH